MKTFEMIELINYTVNKIVHNKKYQELEKTVIIAKIEAITKHNKKNLNQEQILQVIYKELGVKI